MNGADNFFSLLSEPERRDRSALRTSEEDLTYAELCECVRHHIERLAIHQLRVIASLIGNSLEWIIHDLACLKAGVVHVPLPLFFSPQQWLHTLRAADVDGVVAPLSMKPMLGSVGFDYVETLSDALSLFRRPAQVSLPAGTAKITFTSGSTGTPKGVCIGVREMLTVAGSVAQATRQLAISRHLTALPFPILLENIAGVYAPLILGASIITTAPGKAGLQGSSHFDPALFHASLVNAEAQSVIVLPQMLRAYSAWMRASGTRAPSEIRYVAVGGAAVGARSLAEARDQGIPAYEGYGLSEACSVQTLNLPGDDCPGSAGRPLPHARLRVAADGEIEVSGTLALAYLDAAIPDKQWLPTGDLGYLDKAGFLHIHGRKKSVLVTAYGRNVSPEWVEAHMTSGGAIVHAVVLGDGEPALGAVIWPLDDASDQSIDADVERANEVLPDYARIARWVRARAEFCTASGLATANGRPNRHAVAVMHADLFSAVSANFLP